MLTIKNLHVSIEDKPILNGIDLSIKPGEIHAVMGPNGSGKSTLCNIIMGHPKYTVTNGDILFSGKSILKLPSHKRALMGLFLAFQYPREITGITLEEFLLTSYRAHQKYLNPDQPPILVFRFKKMLKELMQQFKMEEKFADRYLNYGFSGGEKKKSEVLQMAVLKPRLAILDETDSGLDVDALKTVCDGVKSLQKESNMGALIVTHYHLILDHIKPTHVHVLKSGKIIKSGGKALAEQIASGGYENI